VLPSFSACANEPAPERALSTWSFGGQSDLQATAFGTFTILWVTLTQAIAFALGGYLAGHPPDDARGAVSAGEVPF